MLLLLALLAAAGLLAGGEVERSRKAGPGGDLPVGELVDAILEGGELDEAERRHLAAELRQAGYTAEADRLLGAAPSEPAAPTRRQQALAVLAVVRDYTDLGGDEAACLALDPELVKAVQRAFQIEPSGRWDMTTALMAQDLISTAPAACDLADIEAEPAEWVRP